MKYYKDADNRVFAYASDGSQDVRIPPGLTPITEYEANGLRFLPPSRERLMEHICARRDALLLETDWYVVRFAETGKEIPETMLAYRQALREINQQSGYPFDIEWPVLPW
ncbi:MAG: phage tail assembly chaperone [Burkholderiaceae bacterium]|jgi:hypothetical protein|nr:phage tail assembly chaperone [Burkholderiaceae bacterium]